MDPRAAPLAGLLRLNARLVASCFDDVDDARAVARALPGTNSMAFNVPQSVSLQNAVARRRKVSGSDSSSSATLSTQQKGSIRNCSVDGSLVSRPRISVQGSVPSPPLPNTCTRSMSCVSAW